MRDVWGLIVALTGLLIVWLWATGRAAATWQAVTSGTSGGSVNPAIVNFNPPNIASGQYPASNGGGINTLLQFTPPAFTLQSGVPNYVPTVGNQAFNVSTGPAQ